MRVAAVLMLLAACGDNLATLTPESPQPRLTCWADIWQTDHTVSAVGAMTCLPHSAPEQISLRFNLGDSVGRWRMHWVDCYSTVIDTYDLAEMPRGTVATAVVVGIDGDVCKTGEIQLLRQ